MNIIEVANNLKTFDANYIFGYSVSYQEIRESIYDNFLNLIKNYTYKRLDLSSYLLKITDEQKHDLITKIKNFNFNKPFVFYLIPYDKKSIYYNTNLSNQLLQK